MTWACVLLLAAGCFLTGSVLRADTVWAQQTPAETDSTAGGGDVQDPFGGESGEDAEDPSGGESGEDPEDPPGDGGADQETAQTFTYQLSFTSCIYDGTKKTPQVKVYNTDGEIVSPDSYTVSYQGGRIHAGTYRVTIVPDQGTYPMELPAELSFVILPKEVNIPTVTLEETTYVYNGSKHTPCAVIRDADGCTLTGENYRITYEEGRTKVGTYTVRVVFTGDYKGSAKASFKIIPRPTRVLKYKTGQHKIKIRWRKRVAQNDGYQIRYSKRASMKKAKKITVLSAEKTKRLIKHLKKNKNYYIQIRTFKKADGKRYYSEWSNVYTIRTKENK